MKDRVWTISNALSFLRILLVAPIGLFLLEGSESSRWWAAGIMTLAVLTDFFDGLLARVLNQATELGKIIDPLADKIATSVVIVILAMKEMIPTWFLVVAIARDALILAGAIYLRSKQQMVLQSNMIGKITVCVVALLVLVSTLDLDALGTARSILVGASTLMIAASFLVYARRFLTLTVSEGS